MASRAWSREKPSSEPVTTTVRPSRVRATDASRSSAIRTPAAAHLSTIWACQSTANHSMTASAMTPPTPSAWASSSRDAARMASIEPNCDASARAAVGPTCRIERATSTRHSGCCCALAKLSNRRTPLTESTFPSTAVSASAFLAARVNSGTVSSCSGVSANRSPSSVTTPAFSRATAPSQPSTSMSNAPRPARPEIRSRSWAGQVRALGQRMSLSPSFSGASGVPHAGHAVGIANSRSAAVAQLDDRPDDLGDHVAGLAQHHGVADEHALAAHLVGVVQRGPLDRGARDDDRGPSRRTASPARCGRR